MKHNEAFILIVVYETTKYELREEIYPPKNEEDVRRAEECALLPAEGV